MRVVMLLVAMLGMAAAFRAPLHAHAICSCSRCAVAYDYRAEGADMMGRKFENNKVKMAKTALAYAKKASYIGKKVVVAVKAGSSDPAINRQLASIMDEANALNVPKDVINKNVKRAEDPDVSDYKELVYEAYAHGGVGLIIACLSDNNNRAAESVGTACKREGCKTAASGSVAFNFEKKGRLPVRKPIDEDALLELAIDGGCEGDVELAAPDVDRGDDEAVVGAVMTSPGDAGAMQAALQAAGWECAAELVMIPIGGTEVQCNDEDEAANFQLIERLEAVDDVASVYHNMRLPAEPEEEART